MQSITSPSLRKGLGFRKWSSNRFKNREVPDLATRCRHQMPHSETGGDEVEPTHSPYATNALYNLSITLGAFQLMLNALYSFCASRSD